MKTLGLLTVSQAADYLSVPRPTLYQHLREGRIPGIQIGGRWRIELKVLQRFLGVESPSEGTEHDRGTMNHSSMNPDEEMRTLKKENLRLREIIAQQLLEIHQLSAEGGVLPFAPQSKNEDQEEERPEPSNGVQDRFR